MCNDTLLDVNGTVWISREDIDTILRLTVYVVQGSMLCVGNVLLLLPIFVHKGLRIKKEFVLVGSLALANCLIGSGFANAGFRRIRLLRDGESRDVIPRWECLTGVYSNMIWAFVEVTQGTALAAISIDRLLLVLFPMWYLGQKSAYIYVMVLLTWLPGFINGGIGVFMTWKLQPLDEDYESTKICFLNISLHPTLFFTHMQILSISTLASVVLFVLVVILYRRRSKKLQTRLSESQMKYQRNIFISLAISSFFTLVLNVIPIYIDSMATVILPDHSGVITITASSLSNLNALMNLFIFLIRHEEIRHGLLAVFQRRTLSLDVSKWNVGRNTVVPVRSVAVPKSQVLTPNNHESQL